MFVVTQETFESLAQHKADPSNSLRWPLPFVLPAWLKTWWEAFGEHNELYLAAVRDGAQVIGIAPLKINAGVASVVGSENVCDCVDFIVVPGREKDFFNTLIDDLRKKNIGTLEPGVVRPDSVVMTKLIDIAGDAGCRVSTDREDVSYEMDLPPEWDGYFALLNTKQRHEVRRKLRRLEEEGSTGYSLLTGDGSELENAMDTFMELFPLARQDKAGFMTPEMESFFRSLARALAREGLLRLGMMRLDSRSAAAVMCFDYNDTVYLYNSAYDPQYESLSVGLLSKVLCIRRSVEEHKKRFDFLKGSEIYKQRLGGKEVPLYRCQIAIK